jgi:hypothetical protein
MVAKFIGINNIHQKKESIDLLVITVKKKIKGVIVYVGLLVQEQLFIYTADSSLY